MVQVGTAVLRSVTQAPDGARIRIRLADGAVLATSSGPEAAADAKPAAAQPKRRRRTQATGAGPSNVPASTKDRTTK